MRKINLNILLYIALAVVFFGGVIMVLDRVGGFGKTLVGKPIDIADSATRTILGREAKPDVNTPELEQQAAIISTAAAIDSEGENASCLGEVQHEILQIHVRLKKKLPALSYSQIVARALAWMPNDHDYSVIWKNRSEDLIAYGREQTIGLLKPIALDAIRKGPGPGCANKMVRPKFHIMGRLGGEGGGVRVIRTYPADPRWQGKGCKTEFYCAP